MRKWTQDEIGVLKEHYPTKGSKYCSELLGRSRNAVKKTAGFLGIDTCINRQWSKKEDETLQQCYVKYGAEYCVGLLDRTCGAIYERVKILGLAGTIIRWSRQEVDTLKKYYPNYGSVYCSKLLDKPRRSIRKKAFRLKLQTKNWDQEKDNILISYYVEHGAKYCSRLLNKSPQTIGMRASKLGLSSNITNGGFPKKQIIKKLPDNKVTALCKKHGETAHYFRKQKIQHCVKCASIRNVNYKKQERLTPLGLYKSRLRISLNYAFKSLLRINNIEKRRGCFRHLQYSPQQLCDHLEGIKEQQKNTCPICQRSYDYVKLSIDHVIPLKTGKIKDEILKLFNLNNLSLLCLSCNSSKGAKVCH